MKIGENIPFAEMLNKSPALVQRTSKNVEYMPIAARFLTDKR